MHALLMLLILLSAAEVRAQERTVPTEVQSRPGGPIEKFEMPVHEVPVNPPSLPADQVELEDMALVLGVVLDGEAMAYPIRYLALHEVVNDEVGKTPLSPTW